jgi:hypothetical protein
MARSQGLLLTTNSNYHSGFDPLKLGSPATFSLTMSHRLERNCRSTRRFLGLLVVSPFRRSGMIINLTAIMG